MSRPRNVAGARASFGAVARAALAAATLLAIGAFALGCGLGPGSAPTAVQLLVTRDFGASAVHVWSAPQVRGEETAMSLLTRNARVDTRYGGGFVQSIDGLSGGQEGSAPVDWFYYVNGIEAAKGAASTNVHPGDHIWWDRHDWSQTDDVPAVVGSFPEPFLNGIEGKRLPVRVECAVVGAEACNTVTGRLRAAGVPAAISGLGSGIGALQTLRIAVAPFASLETDPGVRNIARGPRASGVYARFDAHGATLALLDEAGRAVQRLGAGAGLIAATRTGEEAPVWVVTGTDASGVTRAARAFDEASLKDRFALAVDSAGALALPRRGSS
ncbi:MAG TPA: DUF4430 domain-containing protein [Solirubrobacteraceae bacterium]|jgi:hypothetical protein|nr:DUF4430 domain-containing protein [Solirubrobacteraceae bacterium]